MTTPLHEVDTGIFSRETAANDGDWRIKLMTSPVTDREGHCDIGQAATSIKQKFVLSDFIFYKKLYFSFSSERA